MTCPNCNSPREDGDAYCGQCGAKLEKEANSGTDFVPLPTGQTRARNAKRKSTKKPKRRLLRIFGSMLLVALLVLTASTWFVLSRFDNAQTLSEVPVQVHMAFEESEGAVDIDTGPALEALNQQTQNSFQPESSVFKSASAQPATTPEAAERRVEYLESPGMTVLLMGVDAGDSEHIDVGVRPDSLSVLHLNPEDGTCRLLGIPRDSRVELPGYGLTKVNHAMAVGGIPYQRLVVQQYLGIEIDHYGLVDFEGVVGVVDSVGGVTVANPHAFDAGGHHFAEGDIEINGEQALAFARYRGGPDGDFGRIDRQQIVMRALLSELGGIDAVRAVPSLLGAAEGHFKTDLSPLDLISIANEYRTTCTASTLETRSLTGTIETHPDPLLELNLSYVTTSGDDLDNGVRWLLTGEEAPDE